MRICTLPVFLLCSVVIHAQQSPFSKFGQVNASHLQQTAYRIDSSANAVVLSYVGSTSVQGNSKGSFSLVYNRHKVVHILNRNGYHEAEVEIRLYTDGKTEEKLDNIRAVTYNYENGKVVTTKLDRKDIFREKRTDKLVICKFTMPNVKEGSIIEMEYRVLSDFIEHVDPWYFQGNSPRLWSEYKFSAPGFFTYSFLMHGFHPMAFTDKKDRYGNFTVNIKRSNGFTMLDEPYTFTAGVTDYRWVMLNIPELKEESFTSSLLNHMSQIQFQLVETHEPLRKASYIENWRDITHEFMNRPILLRYMTGDEISYLKHVQPVVQGITGELERAAAIYRYVRDNFLSTGYGIYPVRSPSEVFAARKGNVPEINLLLTSMLLQAGFAVNPVLLSTRSNGYIYENYPSITGFNYLITELNIGGKYYYLDASQPCLGFGRLMPYCYNGHSRVLNYDATFVNLVADMNLEEAATSLKVRFSDGKLQGSYRRTAGYFQSVSLREMLKSGVDAIKESFEKGYEGSAFISDFRIENEREYDLPVIIAYDFSAAGDESGMIYFSPFAGAARNPFNAAKRLYPVEIPYRINDTYTITVEVPDNYSVDELPSSFSVNLNPGGGSFEFRVLQTGNIITITSVVKLDKTYFAPGDYLKLRDFFAAIEKKHGEKLVLRRK